MCLQDSRDRLRLLMMHANSVIKLRDLDLANRIQHLVLTYDPASSDDSSCFHLNFSDTTYDQDEFAHILFSTLPLFALTPEEYEDFQLNSPSAMLREAYGRITQNEYMSDYGEVLLFLILDYFFEVPKFVTKVRARTSENVPVFGCDGAHVSFNENGDPVLWLGEAKFIEKFSDAITSAVKSVTNIVKAKELKAELRLLDPHIEANQNFDASFMAKIRDITKGAMPIGAFDINIPILLASNSPAAKKAQSLDELRLMLERECQERLETIGKKNWPVMNKVKLHFILFPLSDKVALVESLKRYAA